MQLIDILKHEIEATYLATAGLIRLVEDSELGWKPQSGKNWMTLGQLLKHIPTACGSCIRGFVTGDWGLPPGESFEDLEPGTALAPAEKLPAASSVAETLRELQADKILALKLLDEAGEKTLQEKMIAAPWGGPPMTLGQQALSMINHLATHKTQLFYYLKLQAKDVNTWHLYGLA
jgi:hypothetical protein